MTQNNGYLRLQFNSGLSRQVYNKRQFYKGLGKLDTSENRKWAGRIAARIEADLLHPDAENLFDPTLKKYLGVGIEIAAAADSQSILLEELWTDYCDYKLKTGQICETTYKTIYSRSYSNWLTPYLKETISSELAERIVFELLSKNVHRGNLKKLISALKSASDRAIAQGKLSQNYFVGLADNIKTIKKSQQLADEEDFRAFSKDERDLIIDTFIASDRASERHIAPLIGFLFLTGCRVGEAFALRWSNIKTDWIIFEESYSSETKITKSTKTNTVRIFRTRGYSRLRSLLAVLGKKTHGPNDFVFTTITGKQYSRHKLSAAWIGYDNRKHGKGSYYPGVVARLVQQGKLAQYLKPSATRHTFISLQAHSGTDLKLLADSVGNSVDVIYNHYLGVNREATIANV
ncbi:MAG: tyrosine-type recombinase/integrase [Cyanophyceae cyanobacterium]